MLSHVREWQDIHKKGVATYIHTYANPLPSSSSTQPAVRLPPWARSTLHSLMAVVLLLFAAFGWRCTGKLTGRAQAAACSSVGIRGRLSKYGGRSLALRMRLHICGLKGALWPYRCSDVMAAYVFSAAKSNLEVGGMLCRWTWAVGNLRLPYMYACPIDTSSFCARAPHLMEWLRYHR